MLHQLKDRVRSSQAKAATSVNRELIALYLHIGAVISVQTASAGWGDKIVERLARDLHAAFPRMRGFSRSNLFYMRQVFEAWRGVDETVQQLVGRIPWGHHLVLLAKVRDPEARAFYLKQTVANGWSRSVLTVQIEARLHVRQGRAITNFRHALPSPHSDLAQQTLKDPYVFDFLTLAEDAREQELEDGLVDHVQKFLLELGVGFAFVGRQVHLEVDGRDFYIDLLFYHLKLRCFVVIELKAVPFEPEFAGKLNFYLSAVDEQLRHPSDAPTIGLLLCKAPPRFASPTPPRRSASARRAARIPPPGELRGTLPSVEQLETELGPRPPKKLR